jgi:hypothetical protein
METAGADSPTASAAIARSGYLLAIATHAAGVQARPLAWLPWNDPPSKNPTEPDHDPPGLPHVASAPTAAARRCGDSGKIYPA